MLWQKATYIVELSQVQPVSSLVQLENADVLPLFWDIGYVGMPLSSVPSSCIKFALSKIDQIALPDFYFGAMENWGLVTYRETNLLYDPVTSSIRNKETTATIIAHELAHMVNFILYIMKWLIFTVIVQIEKPADLWCVICFMGAVVW